MKTKEQGKAKKKLDTYFVYPPRDEPDIVGSKSGSQMLAASQGARITGSNTMNYYMTE